MTLTPKQFNKLATKNDLNKFATKVDLDEKFNKLLSAIDGLSKKVGDFQAELMSNQTAHDRMQKHIESLEKRIIKIELRTGIKTKR
jgi:chromosome segregation ATPase